MPRPLRTTLLMPLAALIALAAGASVAGAEEIVVRYEDGAAVRCDKAGCASPDPAVDTSALEGLQDAGGQIRGCYGTHEVALLAMMKEAERRSGRPAPDLTQCFNVALPHGVDAESVAKDLEAVRGVLEAYPAPPPLLPPPEGEGSPDLSGEQWILPGRQDGGMGFEPFWSRHGALGEGVRFVDIEIGLTTGHEDTPTLEGATGWEGCGRSTFGGPAYGDHGLASMGIVVASHNGLGVDGLAPEVEPIFCTSTPRDHFGGVGAALVRVLQHLSAGDVVLIEAQVSGPNYDPDSRTGQRGLVPVEYLRAEFDAIRLATDLGIVVVEPSANGEQDLDDPIYEGRFDREVRDSGALMVCAGNIDSDDAEARSPAFFTNYGSRCDVQAPGFRLHAPGYGDAFDGGPTCQYTATFAGTSGASAVVSGAASLLQSLARSQGGVLTPEALRQLMIDTGQPQAGEPHIGPQVDVEAAGDGVGGIITDPPEPPDGPPGPGQRCEDDCAEGLECYEVEDGEAYCLETCEPFSDASTCGDGEVCAATPGGFGHCVAGREAGAEGDPCRAPTDCGVNLFCGGTRTCSSFCRRDTGEGCQEGSRCLAISASFETLGACLPDERNPDGGDDGSSCEVNDGCKGGFCIQDWPGGYCIDPTCQEDSDCHGRSSRCVLVDIAQQLRYCLEGCNLTSECRLGYICSGRVCQPGDHGPCESFRDCPGGLRCVDAVCVDPDAPDEPDAGLDADAGAEPDAGPEPDVSGQGDAGAEPDLPPDEDDSSPEPGPPGDEGCGCAIAPSPAPPAWPLLITVGLLVAAWVRRGA